MKKIIVCFFVALIFVSTWGCGLNLEKEAENLNTYTASLEFDEENHTLSGNMKVDFCNKSNSTLNELKFNIYPNAFRENSAQPVISLAKSKECYYNGESYGNIEISKVQGANTSSFEICGSDENILKVNLQSPIQPTQSTSIEMEFVITLPNISHRFGYGENTINFGNFLPTLCVFENGKWQEIEYHSNGDPFYSEVANYHITFSYPENMILASTGICLDTQIFEGIATKTISAPAVRDFAMVLSDKFSVVSKEVDGIEVKYFYHSDLNFTTSLETAVKAVATFNNLFGKYPYGELSVVEANFCIGGMEFPNLVLIGDTIDNYDSYQMVIVHEIAHQWWYGVVGNNQTSYAWLDEGLTEFSTALFYEKNAGYNLTYEQIISNANTNMQVFSKVFSDVVGKVDTSMNRNLSDFETENEYIYSTYVEGMLLFDGLKNLLSEKVLIKCLKNYFTTFAFKTVTPADMIASFEKTSSLNLEPFFNSWIQGKVVFTS
ncbi:MAG: M1 family metallopeptidase [Clostridia bacterium]|nr:M1 family metallopeptidase [Clostridia bacterium]